MKTLANKTTGLILIVMATAFLGIQFFSNVQAGKPLSLSSQLTVGNYHLGMNKVDCKDEESLAADIDRANVGFHNGKCIVASSNFVTDGSQILRRGWISRWNLQQRLGKPILVSRVAGSVVWTYRYTLDSPLTNGKDSTREAFLNLFFDEYFGVLPYLVGFELALKGTHLDRSLHSSPAIE